METFSVGDEIIVGGKIGEVKSIDDNTLANLPVLVELSNGMVFRFTRNGERAPGLHVALKKRKGVDDNCNQT